MRKGGLLLRLAVLLVAFWLKCTECMNFKLKLNTQEVKCLCKFVFVYL